MAGQSILINLIGTAINSAAYQKEREKRINAASKLSEISVDSIKPIKINGGNGFKTPEDETKHIIEVAVKEVVGELPISLENAFDTEVYYFEEYSKLKPIIASRAIEYAVTKAGIDQAVMDKAIKKCTSKRILCETVDGAFAAIQIAGFEKKPNSDLQRKGSAVSAESLNSFKKYYCLKMCEYIKSLDDVVLKRILGHFWNAEFHLVTGMSQVEISCITDGPRSSGYSSSAMYADQERVQRIFDYYVTEKEYAERAIVEYKTLGGTEWFKEYSMEEMDEMMDDCIFDNPALKIV